MWLALLFWQQADAVSIKGAESKLAVWTDGKGHYVAAVPFAKPDERKWFFYGNGKEFWQQRVVASSRNEDIEWELEFQEPASTAGFLAFQEKKTHVRCEGRSTALSQLPDAKARSMLAAARFHSPRWKTYPYALARDNIGKYYYVDRQREPANNHNFRLYVGPRGSMKLMTMTNIVSDSGGDIFATKNGELRLVLDKNEAAWIEGKTETKLVALPVHENTKLIHRDLGVYIGQAFGTPCDDF